VKAIRCWGALVATVWFAAIAGCGAGGEGTGNFASGPVEGFGSVVVAGQRFDDGHARVWLEIDPRAPQERALADVKLGVVVQLSADAESRLKEVLIAPEVVGPLAQVDVVRRRFVVAAQTIQVDAVAADPTLFEGARDIADLKPGDLVVVHGRRDAEGVLRATRVVRTSASLGVRVVGRLEQLAAGAAVVNGLAIDLRDVTVLAAGGAPRVGDRVVVFGDQLAGHGTLHALAIGRETARVGSASKAALAGVVTQFADPTRWQLQGIDVDATAFSATDLNAVANGRLVRVSGEIEGGVLKAKELRVVSDAQSPTVTINAAVAEFVDAHRFSLRGTPIDASAVRFAGLTAANLANGVPVQLTATVAGNSVVASNVRAMLPPAGSEFVQAGSVTDWDATQNRFHIFGLTPDFRVTASTVLVGGTLLDLVAGAAVEVRGTQAGNEFTVLTLTFASANASIELAGLAATVEVTGNTGFLQVNEVDIAWDAATVFLGPTSTSADLADGRTVRVRAALDANAPSVLRAIQIDARESQAGTFRLRGTVSDFVSLGDFRLDGQRVDARGATFNPPELATALAGAYVDVEGTLDAGVLRANSVSDP
jgi:hypothetical protein